MTTSVTKISRHFYKYIDIDKDIEENRKFCQDSFDHDYS